MYEREHTFFTYIQRNKRQNRNKSQSVVKSTTKGWECRKRNYLENRILKMGVEENGK